MALRSIKVLDAANLSRRNVVVLELDTPNPIVGVAVGMPLEVVHHGGARQRLILKGIGFASSTPEHAHVIIEATRDDPATIDHIELEPLTAG